MGKIITIAILALGINVISGFNIALAADAADGKKLSSECSVCHGKLGLSKDPEVPSLAGQSAFYVKKSIADYQKGKREHPRMTSMAQPLSMDEIRDLAAWYESLEVTVKDPSALTEDDVSKGGNVLIGNSEAGETRYKKSCINCHGAAGKGVASYPKVSGQEISYTKSKLETYRDGIEIGPNSSLMIMMARPLTDEEILNLGAYLKDASN